MAKRKKQSKMYTRLVDSKTRKMSATQEVSGHTPHDSVKAMGEYLDATCSCCDDPLVADKLASSKAMLAALADRLQVSGISDVELMELIGGTA